MPGKIEEYLRRERKGLDVETPDDEAVWNRISEGLSERTGRPVKMAARVGWIRIRNIAAAGLLMFCLGYIAKDLVNTLGARRNVTLGSIDSRLGQREEQYRQLVSLKARDVESFRGTGNPIVEELFGELERLDTIYSQSVADLKILGPNEKIINTIFDTYENRIRILELIILETNRTKINENYEKVRL
jgi:hypothetical protein